MEAAAAVVSWVNSSTPLLPSESALVFDVVALVSGIVTLYMGYRLDKIVPLRFFEMALPLYIVGGFVTWYGGMAVAEALVLGGLRLTAFTLTREMQPVVMAVMGIMLANIFNSMLKYAKKVAGGEMGKTQRSVPVRPSQSSGPKQEND